MPTDHRAVLASIKTFPQLIAYLRDEMGWPIARDSFQDVDDLFYDFTTDELGIDPKTAAKIEKNGIKRLRPLSPRQPWGIFFIKFEPKKLPVVALRSILSHVALKKRASANSAERTAWAADDLLFVSNYGDGGERQITFAHFSQPETREDLPTLKVLGWDNLNTSLHLDDVADKLTTNLAWPTDDGNIDVWRKKWRSAFTVGLGEPTRTSRDLSVRLAVLARRIRDLIKAKLTIETERGPLTKLMKAFQASLVHDLDTDGFADMYAQTIAYGLLSARIADPHKKTVDDFAGHMRTNPFLRELMETFLKVGGRRGKAGGPGIDFDELGVNEVVHLLDGANMEAVVRDFGDKNPLEDPVIHFYELFLKEYDAKQRLQRGVFYTPRPVVSYIVRSVDELLRTEFGLTDGLADTTTWGEMAKRHKDLNIPEGTSADQVFVQILDPATGTGTFLVEVIDIINKTMMAKWRVLGHGETRLLALWNEYVPVYLLTRLHAYELLMAPYAIAHLKVGLKLFETGYRFGSDVRARIYLTNALEPASTNQGQIESAVLLPALAHEAKAVNEIKQNQRFTVVIGNPPYSGHSSNIGEWITGLVADYYKVDGQPLGEKNPKWLQDDYVKFIRLGEHLVAQAGCGIQSVITNHGYIDNPTFRGLRRHLMDSFAALDVLDLHGNSTKKERSPDGSEDENVFDIKQGVAILAARRGALSAKADSCVRHADLFGSRAHKNAQLAGAIVASRELRPIQPTSPFYLLVEQDVDLWSEYSKYPSITQVMPVNVLGFQTHRDHFAVDTERSVLLERITAFRERQLTDAAIATKYELTDNRDWNVRDARRQLRGEGSWKRPLIKCAYRPFDVRYCFFSTVAMDYPRREMLDHVANRDNLCLGVGRQGIAVQDPVWSLVAIARHPIDANIFRRGGINVFPLWLYPQEGELVLEQQRQANISAEFMRTLSTSLVGTKTGSNALPTGLDPESIVWYAYGVFHSIAYRKRYSEFLKIDFPRLPLPGTLSLFRDIARLGEELAGLHLMEAAKLDSPSAEFVGAARTQVERVTWSRNTVWVDRAQTTGFKGVREAVWSSHIGGYQVCEKWLKDRKGRTLSKDDIAHYQKIVVALSETIRLMAEIDVIIEKHGGWPGAFAGAKAP